MKTIAFFPEAAFGPALNSVGIAQQVEKLGHKAVFICDKGFEGVFKGYGFDEYTELIDGVYTYLEKQDITNDVFNSTLYGHTYHLIVERDRTHLRTKFVFDDKHDIKFCKPVERMGKQQISEGEVQKLLAKAGDGT